MDKHVVTVTFRLQHVYRDHDRGDCYSVQLAKADADGDHLAAVTEVLMRQLLELTGRPLFCGNGEGPWGEGDPESETERRKQGPDRRPGMCRRFRFTYDALLALPPHRASTGPARPSTATRRSAACVCLSVGPG
jgi:hypothetical protein